MVRSDCAARRELPFVGEKDLVMCCHFFLAGLRDAMPFIGECHPSILATTTVVLPVGPLQGTVSLWVPKPHPANTRKGIGPRQPRRGMPVRCQASLIEPRPRWRGCGYGSASCLKFHDSIPKRPSSTSSGTPCLPYGATAPVVEIARATHAAVTRPCGLACR